MTVSERPNVDPRRAAPEAPPPRPDDRTAAAAKPKADAAAAGAPPAADSAEASALLEARRARALRRRVRAAAAAVEAEGAGAAAPEGGVAAPATPGAEAPGDASVVDLIARRNARRRLRRQAASLEELAKTVVARRQVEAPDGTPLPPARRPRVAAGSGLLHRFRPRHIILGSFALVVALPALVASLYLFFVAADQYDSSFSFTIRSLSPAAATGSLLGFLTSSVSGTTTSDSYILAEYLQSQQGIEDLSKQIDLRKIFNDNGADWYFRLGKHATMEDLVKYWNWMVNTTFEPSTGIIDVDVKAFSAKDARDVAQAILDRSRTLVTTLSKQAREDAVSFAKSEVARAEMRLKFANREIQNFRNSEQEIDPTANVKVAMELIGSLQKDLTKSRAEEKQLSGYLDKSSPTLQLLRSKIASIEKQLAEEQRVLGTGGTLPVGPAKPAAGKDSTLSAKVGRYQELMVEQEFAQKAYTTALAGLEKAEVEAAAHDRFLATFVTPTLAQTAEYPRRVVYSLLVFGGLLVLWGSAVLIIYNIRDRV